MRKKEEEEGKQEEEVHLDGHASTVKPLGEENFLATQAVEGGCKLQLQAGRSMGAVMNNIGQHVGNVQHIWQTTCRSQHCQNDGIKQPVV